MILFQNGARKAFQGRISQNDQTLNERDFSRTIKFFEKPKNSSKKFTALSEDSNGCFNSRWLHYFSDKPVVDHLKCYGKAHVTHLFAYAQMLSIREQDFRADSTFPRDTYSPACSFTRSFFRSESKDKKALHIQAHQMQTVCLCDRDHAGSRFLPCNQV